jgi:hypothetical protein
MQAIRFYMAADPQVPESTVVDIKVSRRGALELATQLVAQAAREAKFMSNTPLELQPGAYALNTSPEYVGRAVCDAAVLEYLQIWQEARLKSPARVQQVKVTGQNGLVLKGALGAMPPVITESTRCNEKIIINCVDPVGYTEVTLVLGSVEKIEDWNGQD